MNSKTSDRPSDPSPAPVGDAEPNLRQTIIRLLWEKQFEQSPWHDKFHLIRPDSLAPEYGPFADKLIAAVESHLRECFEFTDKRQSALTASAGEA